jgi:hypothetical protein
MQPENEKFNPYRSEILTAWDLALLSKAMRDAQKKYFAAVKKALTPAARRELLSRMQAIDARVDFFLRNNPSTSRELLALCERVAAVRLSQKIYFSNRTPGNLADAMQLERRFDKELNVILDGLADEVKQFNML